MTGERERHLVDVIAGLRCLDEAAGFKARLLLQGEHVGLIKVTLERRVAHLALTERPGVGPRAVLVGRNALLGAT